MQPLPKNAVQEIDAAPPQTVKPAACLTDLSALPAAASDHSVLYLRDSAVMPPFTFGTR